MAHIQLIGGDAALKIGQLINDGDFTYEVVEIINERQATLKLISIPNTSLKEIPNPYLTIPRKGKGDKAKQRSEWKRNMK